MRPLSVNSETRLSLSFLRTTPARKPRTECCCQSVAFMIRATVAPVGFRSIARMRAWLVADPAFGLDDVVVERFCKAASAGFRGADRVAVFGRDLGLVIGFSEVC